MNDIILLAIVVWTYTCRPNKVTYYLSTSKHEMSLFNTMYANPKEEASSSQNVLGSQPIYPTMLTE